MEDVVVLGVGLHKFGRFHETKVENLAYVAISEALKDAGVSFNEIQAAFLGRAYPVIHEGRRIIQQFGWTGIPITSLEQACASSSTAFREAYLSVAAGIYDTVLVAGVEKMERGMLPGTSAEAAGKSHLDVMGLDATPARVALDMKRRMRQYGESPNAFAQVAVQASELAVHNPFAHYQVRHSLEEVLNSRVICYPLTIYQCCPASDGSSAVVICNRRTAKKYGGSGKSVTVAGWTSGSPFAVDLVAGPGGDIGGDVKAGSLARVLSRRLYEQTGIGPHDIKVCQLHDPFTIAAIVALEGLGIAPEGEGGRWFLEGKTKLDGAIPVNTDGGLLCKGHPLGASGLGQIIEIVHQLRGEAGARQVPNNPKVGLTHNSGSGIANLFMFKV